uniref:DNA fragmentation factor subunit beta n=1 Tax=Chelonoidis abingdonii TaxID=106734 RepID=A0A8C0J037_CHEAB
MAPRPKAFKIRSLRGPQKYGVAARSLPELLRKGGKLLQLSFPDCRLCLFEDGTELTEGYFQSIPDNTDLILLAPGETWQGCKWETFISLFCNLNSFTFQNPKWEGVRIWDFISIFATIAQYDLVKASLCLSL